MPTRIFATAEFAKFARKAKIADSALVEAIERAERGLVGADLGGGVFKLRIARPNEGRSGGFRTIVAFVIDGRAFFLYGFAKNDADSVTQRAVEEFRDAATLLQSLDERTLAALIGVGDLKEIAR